MKYSFREFSLVAGTFLAAAHFSVLADESPKAAPVTPEESRQVIAKSCASGPYQGVVILRNRDGLVGGYVLIPAIRDSPIPYLDHEARHLATFHIFGSNESKQQASAIVDRLRSQFPVEEFAKCPGTPR